MIMANVYTIGHSTHSTQKFLELLGMHDISAIADVRSRPYSRFNPQFNRENLSAHMKLSGVAYVFLGSELGARAKDSRCYVNGKVQYDLLAKTDGFQDGLRRIAKGARQKRIALMCAEKDPLTCHRAILVCRHLAHIGIGAQHIREDGQLESHDDALTRLLGEHGIVEPQLFRSRDELIVDAYRLRSERIAYAEDKPQTENNQ
jgi:uncharacterized protein (DUF488 family)